MQRRRMLAGWVMPLLLLLGVGVLGAIRGGRTGGDIAWASSFQAGLAQAKQSGKPMLLSFHTPGCGWCRKLDAETFTDSRVLDQSRGYVCVRIDSDVESEVVQRFRVQEFPMTLVLNAKGEEEARFAGYVPPETYANALKSLLPRRQ